MKHFAILFCLALLLTPHPSRAAAKDKSPGKDKQEAPVLLEVEPPPLPNVDIDPPNTPYTSTPTPVAAQPGSQPATIPPHEPAPSFAKLRLDLRELWALQSAAHSAGGEITISIETTKNITIDDLLVPLSQSKDVILRKEGDTFVLTASGSASNPAKLQLNDEIRKLENRRNALLKQIQFLESAK